MTPSCRLAAEEYPTKHQAGLENIYNIYILNIYITYFNVEALINHLEISTSHQNIYVNYILEHHDTLFYYRVWIVQFHILVNVQILGKTAAT